MEYIISAVTDTGIAKDTNQDSYSIKVADTRLGKIVVAVLCDGMGGLSKGEVASATVIDAFDKWILNRLPVLCMTGITDNVIRNEWTDIILLCNEKIHTYSNGIGIGPRNYPCCAYAYRYKVFYNECGRFKGL